MAAGAGASVTGAVINGHAGALAKELEGIFLRIQEFQLFLAATDLKVAPYSLTSTDEADIKSAFANADDLRLVYQGRSTVGVSNQARTFVLRLVGPGAHL